MGDDVGQRRRGHDDGAGVDAPLAGHALQTLGQLDDLLRVGVLGVELAELLGLPVALVVGVEDAFDGDVLALDRGGAWPW